MDTINANNNKEISRDEMLAAFLTDDALNDVTLKGSDGVEVRANRFLLAARSPVFRGMFVGKFQEANSSVVELGFQGSVLKALVEYILTDSSEMLATNSKKRKHCDGDQHDNEDGNENATGGHDFQDIQLLVSLSVAASYFHLLGLEGLVIGYFKKILDAFPSLAFSFLQACRMEGPSVPGNLVEFAVSSVQKLPGEHILSKAVACLSADVLEEILKDPDMEMTEYELFRILVHWTEATSNCGQNPEDTQHVAKALSKHIALEKINPSHLSTTVTSSGLVTTEQLCEAYKHQALTIKEGVEAPRKVRWKNELPKNCERPSEIMVTGAGVDAVNGVYRKDGSFKGFPKYSMEGTHEGNSCIFWIFSGDVFAGYWYISIPDKEKPGSEGDIDFYRFECDTEEIFVPPHAGWKAFGKGFGAAPTIFFRIGPKHSSGLENEE